MQPTSVRCPARTMANSEAAPLVLKRASVTVPSTTEDKVGCCCVESSRLARVPVIGTLCRKRRPEEKGYFTSSIGVLLTMMGSVVGTGNIWRFPRILANNSTEGGALAFLLVWFAFLWLWSIPIILIENGIGRFTKKSTVESFNKLLGPSYRFMGGFQAFAALSIGSYYSVIVGWCAYYFVISCVHPLPINLATSNSTWNELQATNHWPVLCHGVAILAAGLSVSKGVATIESVNKVIVPILLVIVVFCFYWALFLPYASEGITYIFTPSFASMKSSKLWLDAISQNAWDTDAGLGMFLTYATFMKRTQGAVKLGTITPLFNNIVSMICGIMMFCTVFSVQRGIGQTQTQIVDTLQYNGPGNSGLTFIWMPLLFGSISGGRFFAVVFFLSLSLAGLSSLIAIMEFPIHVLDDFGIKRIPATILIGSTMFLLGVASAVDNTILVNQDTVWAYAQIMSGCLLLFVVFRYGVLKFRLNLYNNYGIGDWPLPWAWVFVVVFIAPIEGVGLLIWWIVEEIITNKSTWWQFQTESLAVILTEWAIVILVLIGLNWWMHPLVIYEPRNRHAKRILGFFFKLTAKPYPPSDLEQSNPPKVPIEEAKYRPYFLDDTDDKRGETIMPSQKNRRASQSSVTPEKGSAIYSEEEL